METRAHFVLIGAFAMGTVSAAFFFVIWLMKGQADREYAIYDVVFREAIAGLSLASDVKFNGISVGAVTEITIDPDDPSQVITRIRVDRAAPLKTDTIAQLGYQGLTGIAYIDLKGGTPTSRPLGEGQEGIPRIQADAGTFSRLTTEGGEVITSINNIVHRLQYMLRDDNIDKFDNVVANIELLATTFGGEAESFRAASRSTTSMLAKLDASSARFEELVTSITALSNQVQGLSERHGDELLININSSLVRLNALNESLTGMLDENREQIAAFVERGLPEAVHTMQDARRVLRNLDQVLRNIDRDPGTYIFGVSRIAEEKIR